MTTKILIFKSEIRHIYIEQKMKSEKVNSGIRTRTIQWTSSDTEICNAIRETGKSIDVKCT